MRKHCCSGWLTTMATTVGLGGAMIALGSGCSSMSEQIPRWPIVQRVKNSPPAPVNDAPLIIDAAMQARDWDRSTAYYASGDTIAGSTGFLYEPAWNEPGWFYAAEETPLFIVQAVASPVTVALIPPWKSIRWTGETVEPTYTAMPVLPPAHYEAAPSAPPVNPEPQPPMNETAAPAEQAPPTTQP